MNNIHTTIFLLFGAFLALSVSLPSVALTEEIEGAEDSLQFETGAFIGWADQGGQFAIGIPLCVYKGINSLCVSPAYTSGDDDYSGLSVEFAGRMNAPNYLWGGAANLIYSYSSFDEADIEGSLLGLGLLGYINLFGLMSENQARDKYMRLGPVASFAYGSEDIDVAGTDVSGNSTTFSFGLLFEYEVPLNNNRLLTFTFMPRYVLVDGEVDEIEGQSADIDLDSDDYLSITFGTTIRF